MAAARILTSGTYTLHFGALYARLWELADDLGDGTRLYASEGDAALKWVIAELSGTPAEAGKTLPDNNMLRKQVHALLVDEGWADRVNERRFRLLEAPSGADQVGLAGEPGPDLAGEPVPADDPQDRGVPVDEVRPTRWSTKPATWCSAASSGAGGLRCRKLCRSLRRVQGCT